MNAPILQLLLELSVQAGQKISDIYQTDFKADQKADGSTITEADQAAEDIILSGLKVHLPDIPVLAEEAAAAGNIPELGNRFFLVDPLDGTREFVNRTGEFTVNIALIEEGRPVLGVVFTPVSGKLYYGSSNGAFLAQVEKGAIGPRRAISVRKRPASNLIAVASRSHRTPDTDALLKRLGVGDFSPAGSSLKFCLLAEGLADVYPRLGRTMEWDTAAGQAVLEAAGGYVNIFENDQEGGGLTYGKKDRGYDNPFFIAWGRR
ncbi:MAG: 3'(2'),5'-bisphosphate nucleotidase CysQ [bacterium]